MSLADPPEAQAALESLLRWYADMGVDAVLDETPHDRFVAAPPQIGQRATPAMNPVRPEARPASADALVREAEALAAGAKTLGDLRARWEALPGCNLAKTAQMVFSGGTPGAPLMLIAGAPEADDERAGGAFAGAHGRLLDRMLGAIGLAREGVYLAYTIPWRPPGGRPPTLLELSLCLPFARRHIALAAPTTLVCLGERAVQPLLGIREPIAKLRGRWLDYEGDGVVLRTMATFSPEYLLKQPLQKRHAWADLRMLAADRAN